MSIDRLITKQIEKAWKVKNAIVLLGARQVGKTTVLKQLVNSKIQNALWLNADDYDIKTALEKASSTSLKKLIGNNKTVVIDEAQRVENIGITLKLITDNMPTIKLLVSGSSALELANKINEPLTGRKFEYNLFPISIKEMVQHTSLLEEKRLIEHRLVFGMYPEVVTSKGNAQEVLLNIVSSYLYKDLLSFGEIKRPALLHKILMALALQVGSQVSYNELAQTAGTDSKTVERYIDLLEKCFVVKSLFSLSRNLRNEIKKSKKIYFYDNGVRNAILNNFAPMHMRTDAGALWENFMVMERIKYNHYNGKKKNYYFWRTLAQQEIDLIEEADGKLCAFECKYNPKAKGKIPTTFLKAYPNSETNWLTSENYIDFLVD